MDGGARTPREVQDGNARGIVLRMLAELPAGGDGALALVLETEGSTYARPGTPVLFTASGHHGWISGGCLEPEIERRALQVAAEGRSDWMEIDTRDDAALFSGNAVGCRGCQRIVLLPLGALRPAQAMLENWLHGPSALHWTVHAEGRVELHDGDATQVLDMPTTALPWQAPRPRWQLQWHRPPRVRLLGAGPEAITLIPLLQGLGWQVEVSEPRETWRARLAHQTADHLPSAAMADHAPADAVLVMHHAFELDLQALEQLALHPVPFIGLLGPPHRRDDLFSLLTPGQIAALRPCLRSPVGLALGGRGPEAIALSIAAQLQAWRHGTALDSP